MQTRIISLVFTVFIWVLSFSGYSQTDSTASGADVQKLLQMIEQLQRNQDALERLQEKHSQSIAEVQAAEGKISDFKSERQQSEAELRALRDSLSYSNQRINQLVTQIQSYREEIEKQEAVIKDVTKRVELTDEARYVTVRNNLEHMMQVFELLNEKMNTLDAISQVDSYRSTLSALNNPADESLGFSYNKKVLQLLDEKIQVRRDKGRILEIAESILKNPTVSTITQNTPILNIGTTLIGFISNIAANDKNVEPSAIFEFKQELNKYTQYYVQLNEANSTFQLNMHDFQVQTKQLHSKLEEFVVKTLEAGKFEVQPRSATVYQTEGAYLAYVFRSYNKDYIERYLRDLERRYEKRRKTDYAELMQQNANLIEMSKYASEVAYLFKQFDYLYSKYIAILEKNNRDMVGILDQAKRAGLSDDNSKIDRKIQQLKEKKEEAIRSIETAINIQKLQLAIDRLDLYYMGGGF